MNPRIAHALVRAAGWLGLVAVAGGAAIDALWWALVPATGLLAAGLMMRPVFAADGLARLGSVALALTLVLALAANTAGLVSVAELGFEPAWVGRLSAFAGIAILVAAALLGFGIVSRHRGPRWPGVLVGIALPFGFALDWALDRLVLANIFLVGAGFYAGMLLFAIGLIRLGAQGTERPSPETKMTRAPKPRRNAGRRRRVTASTYL